MRRTIDGRLAAGLALVCGLALGAEAPRAMAQDRVMITSTVASARGGTSGAISRRSIERWADALSLNEDQKTAAQALLDGYRAEYDAAQKEYSETMAAANRAYQESSDHSVFAETLPQAQKKFADASKRLEQSLMSDLRSLLSAEQEQAWPRVERMRRREVGGRFSSISGDAVDIVEVVDALKLGADDRAGLAEALEQYEIELDRAMQDRIKAMENAPTMGRGQIDIETIQARMAESREIGLRLKEINERAARKIGSMLPESKRGDFDRAVKERAFPRVYRPTHAGRTLDAAAKLADLDASQREQIAELRSQYEREVTATNDALAAVIERDEADPKHGGAVGGPGGSMVVRWEENQELASARKAKRELDERTRKKLSSILRPEQEEQLPKAEPEEGVMVAPGGAAPVIIR